jgi:hypothetical protein
MQNIAALLTDTCGRNRKANCRGAGLSVALVAVAQGKAVWANDALEVATSPERSLAELDATFHLKYVCEVGVEEKIQGQLGWHIAMIGDLDLVAQVRADLTPAHQSNLAAGHPRQNSVGQKVGRSGKISRPRRQQQWALTTK